MSFPSNTGAASGNQGGLFGGANANNASSSTGTGTAGGGLFGQSAKPGATLFGGSASATGGSGNLFGAPSSTTPAAGTTGGPFGGAAATTAPSTNLFGGGSVTNTSGTGTSGGVFGNTPSTTSNTNATSTAAPPTNPLFGGFGTAKPADTTATKPASSFFLTPNTSSGTTTTTGGGIFGGKPAESTSGTASTTAPLGGGGLFGASKPAAPASTTAAAPAISGFSLGGAPTASASASSFSLGGNKDSTPAPAPAGGLFGGKPLEKKDSTAPAAANIFSLGAAKPDDKNATTAKDANAPAATSANPVVAVPPPSMLRGKTIEEIVNRWTSELETHVKDFSKFAGEVVVWDRALIENGNNLAALYSHVLAAERQQNEIDQTLDHVEQQQKDLLSTLDAYEKVSQEILGGQGGSLRSLDTGPADTERDKNYMLATDLHTNLDDLSASLTQMIDSVNALSISQKPANEGAEDPMAQISQVLSSHLESLQWIDASARELDSKVNEVERRVKESGHSFSGSGQKGRGFGLNR